MAMNTPRQYIIIAPPNVAAGIGEALCRAYHGSDMRRTKQMFERLIERLDRLD